MLRTRLPLALLGAALIAVMLAGCSSSSSGTANVSTGRVAVLLTDQPSQFAQVLVTVESVQVHTGAGPFVTVANQQQISANITQPIDLLTLQNVEKLAGIGEIPAGTYTQMRLILAPGAEVVLPDGSHHALRVPSGAQTGLKTPAFTVPANQTVFLLVDIKTDQIHAVGGPKGDFLLPPTAITVTVFTGPFGALEGTVAPVSSAAVVTAFFAGTSVAAAQGTIDPVAGAYQFTGLLPGQYYLTASATGFEPFDSRPTLFAAVANATTEVPLITLTPIPPPGP